MKEIVLTKYKHEMRMKDNGTNTLQDIWATEWFAPIYNLQPRAGQTRVVEALEPIGDPPIALDLSSVSEDIF